MSIPLTTGTVVIGAIIFFVVLPLVGELTLHWVWERSRYWLKGRKGQVPKHPWTDRTGVE